MNEPNNQSANALNEQVWSAGDGTAWRVSLEPHLIKMTGLGETYTLPSDVWARDVYVVPHGDGYIVRFETDARSIGFILSAHEAAPLLKHVQGVVADAVATPTMDPESPEPPRDALLWPRVSPLAVWALITSSMAFVPVLGVVPALITVVLLILHRLRVRRAAAYRHSRALCVAAFALTVTGLMVSALGTWGLLQNTNGDTDPTPWLFERAPGDRETAVPFEYQRTKRGVTVDETSIIAEYARHPVRRAGFLDEEHNWPLIVLGLLAVVFSLTVHECAHAITAWWLGDDLARRLGRVTLNPAAHIDPFGTVILPLILFLSGVGVFGWAKPVPVQLEGVTRRRRAHILISIAGPGSNLLLAAVSMMLLIAIGCGVRLLAPQGHISHLTEINFSTTVSASGFALAPMVGPLCTLLQMSFLVNVFLAFFNLIPLPPLDGSWVLEHLFPRTLGPIYERIRPYALWLFLGLIYTGVLVYLLAPAFYVIGAGFAALAACTGF